RSSRTTANAPSRWRPAPACGRAAGSSRRTPECACCRCRPAWPEYREPTLLPPSVATLSHHNRRNEKGFLSLPDGSQEVLPTVSRDPIKENRIKCLSVAPYGET